MAKTDSQTVTGNIRRTSKRKNAEGDLKTPATTIRRGSLPPVQKKAKSDSEASSEDEDNDFDKGKSLQLDMLVEIANLKNELLRRLEAIDQRLDLLANPVVQSSKPVQNAQASTLISAKSAVIAKVRASTTTTKRTVKSKPVSPAADGSDDDDDSAISAAHRVGAKGRPELLLAEKWDLEKGIDPTDWWISEKLDGVRAFWNGSEFCSREGNKFYAPEWFTKKFPKDITLDGELFAGRGTFQEAVGIIRTKDQPARWKFKIEYHVFDIPSMADQPFETRYNHLQDLFTNKIHIRWVKVAPHTLCTSRTHLLDELSRVQDLGGEGLMLREPESLYIGKRSRTLLKVKTFLDADAEVIGYEEGSGKNQGKVGALKCRALDGSGTEFKVGSGLSDKQRVDPPKIGTTIIYRYFELSKSGHPRFPTYVGERAD